jgi:HD-like signal output (HDOD) protein
LVTDCEGAERKLADEAYVAGLLHDVGKLVLAGNLTDEYERVISTARTGNQSLAAVEKEAFGADHADVGGYLLGLWGLPVPVVEAIALHHKPMNALIKTFSPLTALHAGNILASVDHPSVTGIPPSEFDTGYLDALGLKAHIGQWRSSWHDRALVNAD